MKKLILLALLTSCGYVKVPLFEKHLGKDKHEHSKSSTTMIQAAKPYICGAEAYRNNCTSTVPSPRILAPLDLYSRYCYDIYINCLRSR